MSKSSPPKLASVKRRTATPKLTSKRTRKNKTSHKVVAEKVRGVHRATAPRVSAEGARVPRNTTALLEQSPGTQLPNTSRGLAEKNVAHTRELYEASKNTLQAVMESWQKSFFGAAGQGVAAVNRRFIELAERNMNSSFDLATGLAGAQNWADVVELQATYWRTLLGGTGSQRQAFG